MNNDKWNRRFIELCLHIAQWSKDPSTKVGAVIVRPDKTIASLGYNGFPAGIDDKPEFYENKEIKMRHVVHAEMNAILHSNENLSNTSLYVSHFPCKDCIKLIVQKKIKKVFVCVKEEYNNPNNYHVRAKEDIEMTKEVYKNVCEFIEVKV